jgi:hypothetical protein
MPSVPLRNGFSNDEWCQTVVMACADLIDTPPTTIEMGAVLPDPAPGWQTVDFLLGRRLLALAERLWFSPLEATQPGNWRIKTHERLPAERTLWTVLRMNGLSLISLKWDEALPFILDEYSGWEQRDLFAYDLQRALPVTLPTEAPDEIAAGVTGWTIAKDMLEDQTIREHALRPLRGDLPTVAAIERLVNSLAAYRETSAVTPPTAPTPLLDRKATPELYETYAAIYRPWYESRRDSREPGDRINDTQFLDYVKQHHHGLWMDRRTFKSRKQTWLNAYDLSWPPSPSGAEQEVA